MRQQDRHDRHDARMIRKRQIAEISNGNGNGNGGENESLPPKEVFYGPVKRTKRDPTDVITPDAVEGAELERTSEYQCPFLLPELWTSYILPELTYADSAEMYFTCKYFYDSDTFLATRFRPYRGRHLENALEKTMLVSTSRDDPEMFLYCHYRGACIYTKLLCPCLILARDGCLNILKMIFETRLTVEVRCSRFHLPDLSCKYLCQHVRNREPFIVSRAVASGKLALVRWLVVDEKMEITKPTWKQAIYSKNPEILDWLLNYIPGRPHVLPDIERWISKRSKSALKDLDQHRRTYEVCVRAYEICRRDDPGGDGASHRWDVLSKTYSQVKSAEERLSEIEALQKVLRSFEVEVGYAITEEMEG